MAGITKEQAEAKLPEEVETKLRSVRMILQEKVNQLKEQVSLPFI